MYDVQAVWLAKFALHAAGSWENVVVLMEWKLSSKVMCSAVKHTMLKRN